jgi:cytoskeletal protein CcmA (bactofilin family)
MPSAMPDKVSVACPSCGHRQLEPRSAYSSLCKKCRQHFRLDDVLHPTAPPVQAQVEQRHIRCYQCGTELAVPLAAKSSMCRRCSAHVDLTDYRITQTVSKNFRTHGRLVIEEKGYVLNSEAIVSEAVVKGRFIGKLKAAGTLEIHSSANIKGSFTAGCLVIPAGHHFRWSEPIQVEGATINGEWVGALIASGTVRLGSAARYFGVVEARNLVVEAGAVMVGTVRIGHSA